ncbi:MAG: hypothetical protein AAF557_06445 [Pseudomonadota bacterium]
MLKTLTAAAIAVMVGLGGATAAQAAPVQTLSYSGQDVELHQAGFKKFKHRGNFRSRGFHKRGFSNRRFRHGKFNRGRFLRKGFHGRPFHHGKIYKDGKFVKKGVVHKGHHGHGVVVKKKKFITPFGFVFKK